MPIAFTLVAVLVVLVIAAAVYGVFLLLNPTRTASDRLRDLRVDEPEEADVDLLIQSQGEDDGGLSSLMGSEEDRNILRRMLVQAGYKHKNALQIFTFTRVAMALGLPVILLPATANLAIHYILLVTAGVSAFGYMAPLMMVQNNVTKRKEELLKSFPDTLDLLVSSVEAGLGIDAAFRRVSAELEQAAPGLAREFQLVNNEISAGVPRIDALRRLEKRTGLDEIRSLVNMLAQAERFGTSIASSLRVHANVTRQKRMAKAEEAAAKVSPKLTVVMILFLLPVLKMVLLGPAAIKLARLEGAP